MEIYTWIYTHTHTDTHTRRIIIYRFRVHEYSIGSAGLLAFIAAAVRAAYLIRALYIGHTLLGNYRSHFMGQL